jgi:hypothetical protein
VVSLAGELPVRTSQGSLPFNVNGKATQLSIAYHGRCNPGTLGTEISPTQAMPYDIVVNGDIYGCFGSQPAPFLILIDSELFAYANIGTETTSELLSSVQPSPSAPAIVNVNSTAGFPPPNLYLGAEYFSFDQTNTNGACATLSPATQFCLTGRALTRPGPPPAATLKANHPAGSLVRAQGRLRLLHRTWAKYVDGTPDFRADGTLDAEPGATLAANHVAYPGAGYATVRSPNVQLTCRARLTQTPVADALDLVTSRSRCYTRLEPDPPWPDPYAGPLLALTAGGVFHDISTGTIIDEPGGPLPPGWPATTLMSLTTGIQSASCFEYVRGMLWVKITQQITVDKSSGTPDLGQFRISLYTNNQCDPPAVSVLGELDGNNLTSTELPPGANADNALALAVLGRPDPCDDFQELGPDPGIGGKRDPYNPYDYFDLEGNGSINVLDDIIGVASAYGSDTGPNYTPAKDRGPQVPDADGINDPANSYDGPGPADWNRSAPDGTVNIFDDILVIAGQFGNNC